MNTRRKQKNRLIDSPETTAEKQGQKRKVISEDEGSSSDSSVGDYLKAADEIDLNSSFFDINSEKAADFAAIEKKIFTGVERLSDSDSDVDDLAFEETDTNVPFDNSEKTGNDSVDNFTQLNVYNKKLEEAKACVQKYEKRVSKKPKKAEHNVDITRLLSVGEAKNEAQESMEIHHTDGESDDEMEWEEIEEKQDNIVKIPKEGVQITVEFPNAVRKKAKGVDLLAVIKRRMNRIKKENQVYVHKVHLLCWIAHGNLVNAVLNSENLLGMALSLLPSEQCYPPKHADLSYLEQIVRWYGKMMKITEKPSDENVALKEALRLQIEKKQAWSKRDFVLIFVIILRSLGLQCRLVLSLQCLPLRPLSSELCSVSTKDSKKENNKGNKGESSKTAEQSSSTSVKHSEKAGTSKDMANHKIKAVNKYKGLNTSIKSLKKKISLNLSTVKSSKSTAINKIHKAVDSKSRTEVNSKNSSQPDKKVKNSNAVKSATTSSKVVESFAHIETKSNKVSNEITNETAINNIQGSAEFKSEINAKEKSKKPSGRTTKNPSDTETGSKSKMSNITANKAKKTIADNLEDAQSTTEKLAPKKSRRPSTKNSTTSSSKSDKNSSNAGTKSSSKNIAVNNAEKTAGKSLNGQSKTEKMEQKKCQKSVIKVTSSRTDDDFVEPEPKSIKSGLSATRNKNTSKSNGVSKNRSSSESSNASRSSITESSNISNNSNVTQNVTGKSSKYSKVRNSSEDNDTVVKISQVDGADDMFSLAKKPSSIIVSNNKSTKSSIDSSSRTHLSRIDHSTKSSDAVLNMSQNNGIHYIRSVPRKVTNKTSCNRNVVCLISSSYSESSSEGIDEEIMQINGTDGQSSTTKRTETRINYSSAACVFKSYQNCSLLRSSYSDGSDFSEDDDSLMDSCSSEDSDAEVKISQVDGADDQPSTSKDTKSRPNWKVKLKENLDDTSHSSTGCISKHHPLKTKASKKKLDKNESAIDDDFALESQKSERKYRDINDNKKLKTSKSSKSSGNKIMKGDIREDIVNLVKGQMMEQKHKARMKLVKRKEQKESDSDSDYEPDVKKGKLSKRSGSEEDFKLSNTAVKRRVKPRSEIEKMAADALEDSKKKKQGIDVWVEVYLEAEEKWISADLIKGQVHCVSELHNRATQPVSYILAWNNNFSVKDVTARYCPNWNTVTRKLRVDPTWWNQTLKPYVGVKASRDKEEDEDLARQQLDKPLPKVISEYKNHPLYVLKRHLLKFEAIYPPDALTLGFVRNEAVYARECVHTLHSREIWVKHAKVVKPGQQPYKIVKARPKYDRLTGNVLTDLPLEIFGSWQVEDYVPPTAENGIVPRNPYGNVELFKPCMLPKKTAHLQLPGLNKIARKLQIDCAPAVVAFDFHAGGSHPVFDGYVVCEEFKDILIAAWEEDQVETAKKEQEKYEKRVYGNWRKLIRGLLIRERLKAKYNFGSTSSESGSSKSKGKGSKIICKKRKICSDNESGSD